jgi:hypothetical protein
VRIEGIEGIRGMVGIETLARPWLAIEDACNAARGHIYIYTCVSVCIYMSVCVHIHIYMLYT